MMTPQGTLNALEPIITAAREQLPHEDFRVKMVALNIGAKTCTISFTDLDNPRSEKYVTINLKKE